MPRTVHFSLLHLIFLAPLMTGCLNTKNRKIELQDELIKEKLAKQALNSQKKTFKQLVEEDVESRRSRQINNVLATEEVFYANARRRIREVRQTVPADPYESFEVERQRVLDRDFTDTAALRKKGS